MVKKIAIAIWILTASFLGILVVNYVGNRKMIENYGQGVYQQNELGFLGFTQPYINHFNKGNVFYQLGDYQKAKQEYQLALNLRPDEPYDCKIRVNYALSYVTPIDVDDINEDNYKDVIEICETAKSILAENDCATENNDGHYYAAQKLYNEINQFIEDLKNQYENPPTPTPTATPTPNPENGTATPTPSPKPDADATETPTPTPQGQDQSPTPTPQGGEQTPTPTPQGGQETPTPKILLHRLPAERARLPHLHRVAKERHLHLHRAVTTVHLPRHQAAKERELRHLHPAAKEQEHLHLLRAAKVQAHLHLHRAVARARVHRLLHLHLRIVSATFRTEVTGNVMVVRVTTMTTTTSVTPQAGK